MVVRNPDLDRMRRLKAGLFALRDERRFKGGGSSPPPAPDPNATAAAQAAANKEAAISQAQINMVNQNTPYGSLEYSQRGTADDGTPQYTATQKLAEPQQQMLDLTNQAGVKYGQTANTQLDAVSSRLAQPLDYTSLGAAPVANEATRTAVRDSMLSRLEPQFQKDESALRTRLANQGIVDPSSQAFQAEMDSLTRARNDARLAADMQAGGEMSRVFGLESTARDKAINEMVQQRQVPLNELAAMLSGTQVQGPQFVNTPQQNIGAAPVMESVYGSYNGQMNAYNAKLQADAANTAGLYGLLGSGAMAGAFAFSDFRLKRDIEWIGRLGSGLNVYRYRYLWSDDIEIGLMAHEVRKVKPHAVKRVGGFDAVNYAEALA